MKMTHEKECEFDGIIHLTNHGNFEKLALVRGTPMNLNDIAKNFDTEDRAIEFFEGQRWPDGKAICPQCGVIGESTKLPPIAGKPNKKGRIPYRRGVWKCRACRRQFSVQVGTIFESSHIPLSTWLKTIHLMCASKKGISSHQIHRMLGITYKSAWFMTHRIRLAMRREPMKSMLLGTVEVDETYIGGKERLGPYSLPNRRFRKKAPVVALVERGGMVRSFHRDKVTSATLKQVILENVDPSSHVMTDDHPAYGGLSKLFRHSAVRHSWKEYARREGGQIISTNTIEGFFAILKRGVNGVFHHVGKQHLHRYLNEFDFRYNARHITDGERTLLAISGIEGKRLRYKEPLTEGRS